ncbi:hypothetical protein BLL40_15330 [Domibacillus mangrovi]|uniref:Uncharacterized protein n=1 Tax=Domibacillus mangrovi TaxID=1714354 RepID=A0A1Q5NZH3_9BACI|nr:hypothetical protein BLL40_15330 [Domibacillus mangrovi]
MFFYGYRSHVVIKNILSGCMEKVAVKVSSVDEADPMKKSEMRFYFYPALTGSKTFASRLRKEKKDKRGIHCP